MTVNAEGLRALEHVRTRRVIYKYDAHGRRPPFSHGCKSRPEIQQQLKTALARRASNPTST